MARLLLIVGPIRFTLLPMPPEAIEYTCARTEKIKDAEDELEDALDALEEAADKMTSDDDDD